MSGFRPNASRSQSRKKPAQCQLRFEQLEDRTVPATFTVSNLADSGAGSFRQAIIDANSNPGADVIDFSVAGTIQLTSTSLAPITDVVVIDGTTAPGFATTPTVEIDYNGLAGLRFAAGSNGSTLRSTGHINAAGNGIALESRDNIVAGNFIGVQLNGTTAAGNTGDGLRIRPTSRGNTIGGTGTNDANVISGNGGNGITIVGSTRNKVVANFIGTDSGGGADLGNAVHGIQIMQGATLNTIGGTTPVDVQFSVKPPDGNVISGNGGNGVFINSGSKGNDLSGNFIGTDLSGLIDLGNTLDGVAIVNADNNSLVGIFRNMEPFLFYNVISGNDGNGLRVNNSDNTVIHANFFGLGATNMTKVPNTLSGVVIEGNSNNTIFGGVIPLGNVTAGNGQHGVVVKDTASNFLAFNTFAGIGAFSTDSSLGNSGDGFHITSTGTGNVLRTNIISSNGDDGLEISGNARGVQVVQNFIGLDTFGNSVMANADNGVEIGGNAHNNVIGGPQTTFSVTPRNVISGNLGYGVAVIGTARDNTINFSYIGTDLRGTTDFGNVKSGVFLGAGTSGTTIGSRDPNLYTLISGNGGHGIEMQGTTGNIVIGTSINTDAEGIRPMPNTGSGVFIANSSGNRIGGTAVGAGNTIAFSLGDGVRVESGSRNSIRGNSIHSNALLGIGRGPTGNPGAPPPILTSAVPVPGQIRVEGRVTGQANTTVTIDVFANFDEETLGTTEGRFYLGSVTVQLNANGRATFTFIGYNPPPGVQTFTATATNASGTTSEFTAAILSFPLGVP